MRFLSLDSSLSRASKSQLLGVPTGQPECCAPISPALTWSPRGANSTATDHYEVKAEEGKKKTVNLEEKCTKQVTCHCQFWDMFAWRNSFLFYFLLFFNICVSCIYLAALSLSYSTRDLRCIVQNLLLAARGLSSCGIWAQKLQHMGLVALWHVGS